MKQDLFEKIGDRKILKSHFERLIDLNSKYAIKTICGEKPAKVEIEAHEKYEQYINYIETVEIIPEWFDGNCHDLHNAIEAEKEFEEWELQAILQSSKESGRFASVKAATKYLRIARAQLFLKAVEMEIEALGNRISLKRLDLKKLKVELEESISSGKGVPKTGRRKIEIKIDWESKQRSQSIAWNRVIKVPRMG